MGKQLLEFHNVSFAYESQSEQMIKQLSLQFSTGWTGVVGANGVGKSTLLKLATGLLEPVTGMIRFPAESIYCQQRTDDMPEDFISFVFDDDRESHVLKGRLKIELDWADRWDSLSHGERKRAQIGTALWRQPELLAIDEPTNHLDAEARDILLSALLMYNGIGLIISHDKGLLDTLCTSSLFINPPDYRIYPGNFSEGWKQLRQEEGTLEKQELLARKEFKKLDREVTKRRIEADRADNRRSKKGISRKDHDAKSKIDAARVTGKDAVAGKLKNQLDGRLQQAKVKLDSFAVKKSYETGIWQQGERSSRNTLFLLEQGELSLGKGRRLVYPKLEMRPTDRVALIGPNGSGKSTLISHVMSTLSLPEFRVTYLPQEIDAERSRQILLEVKNLPPDQLGYVMTFVNRLGTRPPRLLESSSPSPGETRKLLLALGAAKVPYLIIMDEPTNHLDLISIECLKEALMDFPGGLLLVSHDREFLNGIADIYWETMVESDANISRLEIF